MIVYRIKSATLKTAGQRFESCDRKRAESRLAEVRKADPAAKLLILPREGR